MEPGFVEGVEGPIPRIDANHPGNARTGRPPSRGRLVFCPFGAEENVLVAGCRPGAALRSAKAGTGWPQAGLPCPFGAELMEEQPPEWRYAMPRRLISFGSTFEVEIGYSRAVVAGEWVFVSGTTGFDYGTMTISENVVEQAEQCFRNIEAALREAGATLADVVRVTYMLPNAEDFPACWPVLRRHFGAIRPAATMIEAGLADPRMKIEIEVTARIRPAS